MKNVSLTDLCKDDAWLAEQLARESDPAHRLDVPEKLVRPSSILKPAITAINGKRRQAVALEAAHCLHGLPLQSSIDFDGLVFKRLPLNLRVTVGAADRAILLMDTLIKACEKRGLQASVGKDGLHIGQGKFSARIRISELVEKKARSLKDVPLNRDWMYRPFSYTPSGVLTIYVERLALERKVSDKPDLPLEAQLNSIIVTICRSITEVRVWRELQEAEARALTKQRAMAEAKRVADLAILEATVAERVAKIQKEQRLIAEATAWQHAGLIRNYADHLSATTERSDALTAWIFWARRTADEIDPTANRLDSDGPP